MTQVSRYPLQKEIEQRVFEVFVDSVSIVRNHDQAQKLVDDLLSQTEKTMLAKRLSIALLLSKKYDQRSIVRLLHVSLTTVNKVSSMVQRGNGGYDFVISSLLNQEKYVSLLQKIDDVLFELFTPGGNWKRMRKDRWLAKKQNEKPF